ncbi:hypothetical protein [Vulcanisaeta distributa]|uniref:hypothetical protein n=1 Tax=Vulcanisaeta distributa TaxID=164451 RepID=UPI0006CFD11F|nr:hypothetical protein [Vulcanisaeta distributa]
MNFRVKTLVTAVIVATIASLLIISHMYITNNAAGNLVNVNKTTNVTNNTSNTHNFSRPPTPPIPSYINFGSLACYNDDVILPNNSIVVLHYHVHGNVSINDIGIYISFPASIINETLSDSSKLPNLNDAMIIGVYVNGRLITLQATSSPINSLSFAVNQPYIYDNKP